MVSGWVGGEYRQRSRGKGGQDKGFVEVKPGRGIPFEM